jgi:alpha-N-arabinofuranosidase
MRIISTGTGGKSPEGPHLYKINNLYYLMLAEGGTEYGHFESISRSPSPWGPFEPCPHNPILTHRSTNQPIQATGHADLFQAENGAWWLVCLGIRPSGYPPYHHIGRETYLAPVRWTADGWPVVGYEGKIDLEMEAGQLPPAAPLIKNETRDDFERAELGLDWNFLRNPYPEQYSLTERPGWLRLKGLALTLNDVDSPAFLGRRQRHFNCSATTRVDFEPQQDRQEAGLTVLMNERHHYEIAVTRLNGLRQVIVRRRIGSLAAVVAHFNVEPGPLDLQVIANRYEYRFRFAAGGQEFVEAASGEARYLATETAGGFTGVYLGMYSSGKGTADFDWFEYRENVFSTTPGSRL